MERWIGKVAVVTGASSGIGAAIAEALVKAGVKVVGAARRVERIEEKAKTLSGEKGKLYAVKVDMANEQDIVNLFSWVEENLGGVDILVNNAGVYPDSSHSLMRGKTENWRHVFEVNVIGLSIASREAIKSMLARDSNGHIIHIGSDGGREVAPPWGAKMNMYAPTKFAIQALSLTLQQELLAENKKIKVSIIAPGLVKTEIFDGKNIGEKVAEEVESTNALEPKDIADAALYVLSTPPNVLVKDLMISPLQ